LPRSQNAGMPAQALALAQNASAAAASRNNIRS
jgi:hypothetical protein